ncbi:MAG: alanine dehydrogenase [Chloroflexi bacterium]|nr:alanine dehydrogenase [Chloroflexota bacterium]
MIAKKKNIGFPRMKKEAGEKRVFLPEFIERLAELGFEIFIEEGYGSRSGFTFDDYQQGNPIVHMCSREEAFSQEYVLVLRSPTSEEFNLIPPGACLISMLHYPTRPKRVALLKEKGIHAISLDSIVDDNNIRLVENMKAVAWNGLEVAFNVLEEQWPGLIRPDNQPWKVLVLGAGMVGKHAVDAGTKLGNIERNNEHILQHGPGAIVQCVGRNLASRQEQMEPLFRQADVLVDATQRRNSSQPVVPNDWIAWLPEHAIITDLAVDPYTLDAQPPVVRGVEGIPQGNLDQYVFKPDDPRWDNTVPASITSQHRRTTVTCYSWPGIHPEACMRHYASQLFPMMEILAEKSYHHLSPGGGYFERALYRASLREWLQVIDQ